MKRILVTGSNGLLGQKLTDVCRSRSEFELVASSKGNDRYSHQEGYAYEDMDVLDYEKCREVVMKHRPDAIINTAAMTNVDQCEKERLSAYALNVEAVRNLAELCKEFDILLVHISTDFIFDGEEGPYSENAKPNPLSYYGQTKLEAEQVLQNVDCRYALLRTIIVYGVVNDMSRSNIVLWAKNALEKGEPINVVYDQWRMPTLAEDLAEACLLAITKQARGIYNVSGSDLMSIIELVERVAEFWKLDKSLITPISSHSLNQTARRPRKTGFILDKAAKDLGYNPRSFETGLAIVDLQLQMAALNLS